MKRGLTIGKFAPLHKGHQGMIEKALEEMDQLYIIIYDAPEHIDIPLERRASWIRTLYPSVIVIEAWNAPKDVGWTEEIQQKHEDYILSLVEGISFDAFYSSEAYGFRMSKALGCKNVIVDLNRQMHSISGTKIRQDLYCNRDYLEPLVYEDFITKIAIYGNVSTTYVTLSDKLQALHQEICPLNPDSDQIKRHATSCKKYFFAVLDKPHHYDAFDLHFIIDDGQWPYKNELISKLRTHRLPYVTLSGIEEHILIELQSTLNNYKKFMNFGELLKHE